jgi:hypothetical protein
MNRLPFIQAALAALLTLGAGHPLAQANQAVETTLVPTCPEPLELQSDKSCGLDNTKLAALKTADSCKAPLLRFTAASGDKPAQCEVAQKPEPKCEKPGVLGLTLKGGKCVVEPFAQKDPGFFDEWATGIAVMAPRIREITDAEVIGGKVRARYSSRQESAILLATHFYPFNQQRSCYESSTEFNRQRDPAVLDRALGFVRNCVGGMVAVGLPTSNAGGGPALSFAGIGLSIGGGVRGNSQLNWHFGFGVGRKFNVRTLGEGWVVDEAPPAGETEVRYQNIDTEAPFIFFTVRW